MGNKCYCNDYYKPNAAWDSCVPSEFEGGDHCESGYWGCKDGKECISISYLCDGAEATGQDYPADCDDDSDEELAMCCSLPGAQSFYPEDICGDTLVVGLTPL